MSLRKTVGLSFRVTPDFKTLLEAVAKAEQRSLTNMLEVILADYCQKHGICMSADESTTATTWKDRT